MRCTGVPVMARPSGAMPPGAGAYVPVSRVDRVVFPAPLGPVMECSRPASIARRTPFTAVRAPEAVCAPPVLAVAPARRAQPTHDQPPPAHPRRETQPPRPPTPLRAAVPSAPTPCPPPPTAI